MYTKEQWITLSERFNKMSFLQKVITIKQNPNIFYIQSDGYNVRLRLVDENSMKDGFDSYFSFPEFLEFSHLKDIFSLIDVKVKNLL
mgnify:CR=1 FL=1